MLFFRLRHRQVDLLPLLLQKLLQLRWVYWYIWFGYSSFHFFSVLVGSNEAIPGLWLNCLVWEHKYQICEWCVFFLFTTSPFYCICPPFVTCFSPLIHQTHDDMQIIWCRVSSVLPCHITVWDDELAVDFSFQSMSNSLKRTSSNLNPLVTSVSASSHMFVDHLSCFYIQKDINTCYVYM